MNQKLKAGILLVTLAIPVFIWLFLKNFGQNQFELPVYYETEVPVSQDCQQRTTPHQVPIYDPMADFEGYEKSALESQVTVSYFFPTVCDTECQMVMEQLANLQITFPDKSDFQIVVIASDDQYDDAELQQFKSRYGANSETWKFVLISEKIYHKSLKCGFFLSEIEFEHSLILTDKNAMIRGYYQGYDSDEIDRLKGELKILFYMQEKVNHAKDSK